MPVTHQPFHGPYDSCPVFFTPVVFVAKKEALSKEYSSVGLVAWRRTNNYEEWNRRPCLASLPPVDRSDKQKTCLQSCCTEMLASKSGESFGQASRNPSSSSFRQGPPLITPSFTLGRSHATPLDL
uniref:Uncharacterized protein n=1 Tax=Steinernema glaseri TaxID=37863 RepID=A0A1I7ZE70_9BILA